MTTPTNFFVVDQRLHATTMTALLPGLVASAPPPAAGQPSSSPDGPPVPVSPDGKLVPGVLYPSSADAQVRFYLPQYAWNVAAGRYTTSLRWRGPDDDPNGPIAFLTLELAAPAPDAQGFTLQEIPHDAVVRIAYEMPVGDGASGAGDAGAGAGAGRGGGAAAGGGATLWIEAGALVADGAVRRCQLKIFDKAQFDRLYQIMTEPALHGRLEIRCTATIGTRTWRRVWLGPMLDPRATRVAGLPPGTSHLLTFQATAASAPKVAPAAPSSPDKAPEKKVDPAARFDAVERPALQIGRLRQTPLFARSAMMTLHPIAASPAAAFSPALAQIAVAPTWTAARAAEISPAISASSSPAIADKNAVIAARPFRDIVATSDLTVKVAGAERPAVPVRIPIDPVGRPVLLRSAVEALETVAPFSFPVETNAYMFDVPGDLRPTSHHILIPYNLLGDGGEVLAVYYQDSAFPDQFYYRPQQFRLPRVEVPPYLPDLRVVFSEVAVESAAGGDGGGAELHYSVHIVYRAVPYIDPGVLDRAQQQAGAAVRFTALLPESSRLTLELPEDETGGALTAVARDGAQVSFDRGVVDIIELTESEFERVFAFFEASSGPGLGGSVSASLLGGLPAEIPVELSLRAAAGAVFDTAYKGPVDGGLHRVTLRNRIESPVRVERLYRVAVGSGFAAFPQSDPGAVVPPGGTLDIDYRLAPMTPPADGAPAPAPPALADLSPLLATSVVADPHALWPLLFVNQGYTHDRFTVQVSIDPQFFSAPPPGGGPALTGVRVDFDSGAAVALTAAAPQAAVELRIPLLARLMGDPQAERYSYRVVNLAGDAAGTPTDWTAMVGDAPLAVVPAGAA